MSLLRDLHVGTSGVAEAGRADLRQPPLERDRLRHAHRDAAPGPLALLPAAASHRRAVDPGALRHLRFDRRARALRPGPRPPTVGDERCHDRVAGGHDARAVAGRAVPISAGCAARCSAEARRRRPLIERALDGGRAGGAHLRLDRSLLAGDDAGARRGAPEPGLGRPADIADRGSGSTRTAGSTSAARRSPAARPAPTAGCAPATWAGSTATAICYVLGRADEVIVTGGENVSPEEVEQVLLEHPAIADAAVVGRDDPQWQRAVVAIVMPDAGGRSRRDELRAFCRERLPGQGAEALRGRRRAAPQRAGQAAAGRVALEARLPGQLGLTRLLAGVLHALHEVVDADRSDRSRSLRRPPAARRRSLAPRRTACAHRCARARPRSDAARRPARDAGSPPPCGRSLRVSRSAAAPCRRRRRAPSRLRRRARNPGAP